MWREKGRRESQETERERGYVVLEMAKYKKKKGKIIEERMRCCSTWGLMLKLKVISS